MQYGTVFWWFVVKTVLYYFSLVHKHEETKTKNKNETKVSNPASKLVHSSSVIAFQIARVIRCSVVDIKANKRSVPIEAYPFALP